MNGVARAAGNGTGRVNKWGLFKSPMLLFVFSVLAVFALKWDFQYNASS
jgi:hypothetical protein